MANTSQRARRALAYEDYLQFPDDGNRHELLEGEHTMTPAPSPYHQYAVGRLFLRFGTQVKEGVAFGSPVDVILAPSTIAQPDLCYVGPAKRDLITRRGVEGPPDIVVEILSPRTAKTDLGAKHKLYASHGVSEYWIVDLEAAAVRMCRLEGGAYPLQRDRVLLRGERLTTPLAQGLDVAAEELFWAS
ncbi:MAG: Uma2 family endonuclease [Acidobacteriota bacterium]